jgi:hypothetical protein
MIPLTGAIVLSILVFISKNVVLQKYLSLLVMESCLETRLMILKRATLLTGLLSQTHILFHWRSVLVLQNCGLLTYPGCWPKPFDELITENPYPICLTRLSVETFSTNLE